MFQTCFECGRRGQVLQSHPLPISPLLQTPDSLLLFFLPLSNSKLLGISPGILQNFGSSAGQELTTQSW